MPPPLVQHLLRKTPTLVQLRDRTILSVSGAHAAEFLNGLLATPVRPCPFFSTFLNAQGRVLHDAFVYTTPALAGQDAYLLEFDARTSASPPLLSYLKRHILRSKVKVRDVTEEHSVWSSWGAPKDHSFETERKRSWVVSESGAVEPVWDPKESPWGTEHGIIHDRRAPNMGRRFLTRSGDQPQEAATHDLASSDCYLLHRILHGVAEGQGDVLAMQAFPMDSNLDIMGALDFRKGCYVGQELTVRTYHTGVIRKRIFPVVVYPSRETLENYDLNAGPAFPSVDIHPVVTSSAEREGRILPRPRGSGKLLSSSGSIALALLRLAHVAPTHKGELELQFQLSESSSTEKWTVKPWWPEWWPHDIQHTCVKDRYQSYEYW